MARNRRVGRAQLEMWLGFLGFFALMAVVNVIGTFVVGGSPVLPVLVAVALLGAFAWVFARWRRDRADDVG